MSVVLRFVPRPKQAHRARPVRPGQVVMFTGVRYQRTGPASVEPFRGQKRKP